MGNLPKLAQPTLEWLLRSLGQYGSSGFPAFYHRSLLWKNYWALPYPETTGYIINTLLNYYSLTGNIRLLQQAQESADWLMTIQKENGAFPGGVGTSGKESIFNTGMIVSGLESSYSVNKNSALLSAAQKAVDWLVSNLESDGSWRKGAYVDGFTPSYYTRVIWAVLKVNKHLQNPFVRDAMDRAFSFYLQRCTVNFSIRDWGFYPEKPAFTHTIAYTLRGIWESALILENKEGLEIVMEACDRLVNGIKRNGRLAGQYDLAWNGNYRFQCLTGNAQLSVLFFRISNSVDNSKYGEIGRLILEPVIKNQVRSNNPDLDGAIPGSQPFWGKYMPFRYPNWAAKFFLDALLLMDKS